MITAQQYANQCVARVHSLGHSYLDTPKWKFLKRWKLKKAYRVAVEEATKSCFDEFRMVPEMDDDGFFFERLQRILNMFALCELY